MATAVNEELDQQAEEMQADTANTEAREEPTESELAVKIEQEKIRLEELLCDQSDDLADATVQFNAANNVLKEKKKHLEAIQLKVNSTVSSLADVLSGRWRPDPQKELPFEDQSDEMGGPQDKALWRSEPVSSLDLPKTILAALDREGFSTLGQLVDEIDTKLFEGLDLTSSQIKKIEKEVDDFVERCEDEMDDDQ